MFFIAAEAWFIPLTDPRPWRKPLSEKQAFVDAMAAWPDKEAQRRKLQALVYGVSEVPKEGGENEAPLIEPQLYRSTASVIEKKKPSDKSLQVSTVTH